MPGFRTRLRWTSDGGSFRRGGFSSAWNHDYPRAEQHVSLILRELTGLDIRTDGSVILTVSCAAVELANARIISPMKSVRRHTTLTIGDR